jgi:hypothetical protein
MSGHVAVYVEGGITTTYVVTPPSEQTASPMVPSNRFLNKFVRNETGDRWLLLSVVLNENGTYSSNNFA